MSRPSFVHGYSVLYLDRENNVLCGDCAAESDVQFPFWEGADMYCDECNEVIVSSYGDPWADDNV